MYVCQNIFGLYSRTWLESRPEMLCVCRDERLMYPGAVFPFFFYLQWPLSVRRHNLK
jgi:hypothetical protein